MGLFNDLAMGLGLKDRDASYYDRTAATLGRTQGAEREARYRQSRAYTEQPTRGGPAVMVGSILDRRQGDQRGGWGYGEGDQRVSALRDMLNGGGRGSAGQSFEGGGVLSAIGNAAMRPSGSRERGEPDMRTGVLGFARDAFNGGGWGQSGQTFQGGPYGGAIGMGLNALGVRPLGYAERGQQSVQDAVNRLVAQQRPAAPAYVPPQTLPAPSGVTVPPVTGFPISDLNALRAEMMRLGIIPSLNSSIRYGSR
jgi:hypothetical protein